MYKVICDGHVLYCDSDENMLISYKGQINYKFNKFNGGIYLPIDGIKKHLVKIRLFERALRLEPRFGFALDQENILFSFHGALYRANLKNSEIIEEKKYRIGMNNPLTICSVDKDGTNIFLYGEYWDNPNREEVGIYIREETGEWNQIFCFPPKTIKHIHFIAYDKYKNRYLIATGDNDRESGIWQANLDFSNVTPILLGKQIYRSCFIVPTEYGFYYATDTPYEQNSIYNVVESDEIEINRVYELPGPCIYGKMIDENVILSTSVEPDYTKPKWIMRFSRKTGAGIKAPYSYIIKGTKELKFHEVERVKKDWHSMWVFQLGNLYFANGDSKRIIATGIALKEIDGKSIEVIINRK